MSAFYLSLLAVIFSGFGARDQVRVAGQSLRQGQRLTVLLIGGATSIATASFAVWAAMIVAPALLPQARLVLLTLTLAFAAAESLILVPRYRPGDTTPTLGMLSFLLLSHQLTDAARFMIFGVAIATSVPIPAGAGGALGGIVLIVAAWGFPELFTHPRTRLVRRSVGAALFALTVYVGLRAFGKL